LIIIYYDLPYTFGSPYYYVIAGNLRLQLDEAEKHPTPDIPSIGDLCEFLTDNENPWSCDDEA
jgi:hypothetical protein